MADPDDKLPHAWVTYVVIALNVVAFVIVLAMGADPLSPSAAVMVDAGANVPALTLDGEPWRLATAMFLHFGLLHLALNLVCLWQGRITELVYGRTAFAAIYLLAGLAGGVASAARTEFQVSAGASGAVFGVYGAFAAFLALRRSVMPEPVWRATAKGIGMFVVINLVFGLTVPGIDLTAHIGGLVIGFVLGLAMLANTERRPRASRVALVAVAGAALVVGSVLALRGPRTNPLREQAFIDAAKAYGIIAGRYDQRTLDGTSMFVLLELRVLAPARYACEDDELATECAVMLPIWHLFARELDAPTEAEALQFRIERRMREREAQIRARSPQR